MTFLIFVVVALAACRATRLIAVDTLTDPLRARVFDWAWDVENPTADDDGTARPSPRAAWRTWVWLLLTCQWCLGVWVSAVVYCAWRWGGDVAWAVLIVLAVAEVVGVLATLVASWESDDD